MIAIIDKNKRYKQNKKIFVFSILIFALISVFSITGIVLLLMLSPYKYIWYMIGAILLSFAYVSFVFAFFMYYFKPIYKRYQFFSKLMRSTFEEGYFKLDKVEDDVIRDGLNFKSISVSYLLEGKTYYRNLYIFEDDVYSIKNGQDFKARYFMNVLIGYEVIDHA